jgi:wobble nucleotide-excising tRNase
MLTKIQSIDNIDPFPANMWPETDLEFKKINLIYGFNGSGKTMFSNFLRLFSASEDTSEIEVILKSNQLKPIAIDMAWDGNSIKSFAAKKKMYTFNANFISEHVYNGTASKVKKFRGDIVTPDKLKNPIINKLENEIEEASLRKINIQDALIAVNNLSKSINGRVSEILNTKIKGSRIPRGLDITNRANIPDQSPQGTLEEIESELNEHFRRYEIELMKTELNNDIAILESLYWQPININYDFREFLERNLTQETLRAISYKITIFKNINLKHYSIQQWLEDGILLLQSAISPKCPLCNSKLDNIDEIINDYITFFGVEYIKLQEDLLKAKIDLEKSKLSMTNCLNNMRILTNIVNKYQIINKLSRENRKSLDGISAESLSASIVHIQELVSKKNVNYIVQLSDQDIEIISSLNEKVKIYNQFIQEVIAIKKIILKLLSEDKYSAEDTRSTLRRYFWKLFDLEARAELINGVRKNDYSSEIESSGIEYCRFLLSELDKISAYIDKSKVELNELLVKVGQESQYVNYFLRELAITNFNIKIGEKDGDEIEVHYSSGIQKRGINNSLSEGEKNTLAFAYFLSKINYEVIDNVHDELEEYILVIDDPVSSLDENRLFNTALLIKNIFVGKTKQLFVLSHNLIFLKYLGNILSGDECQSRQDIYIENGTIKSLPRPLQNYQTAYFYKLGRVMNFVQGKIEYSYVKDYLPNYIRTILETFLSFKLCRLSQTGGPERKYRAADLHTLINSINNISLESYRHVGNIKDKVSLINQLLEIKKQVNPECHGTPQDLTDYECLPDTELRKCAENTITVIKYLDQIHIEEIDRLGI